MISRAFIIDPEKRKRQIDTLKIFNDNVVEICENEEYRVEFKAGGRNMSISVQLSPAFPGEKPTLFVSPLVVHPWLNQQTGEIKEAPGLLNFSVHSDLGRVVQAIIREFERNPPLTLAEVKDHPTLNTNLNMMDIDNNSIENVIISSLNNLSTIELQALQDPDCLEEYLQDVPQVKAKSLELETLMQHVENLAMNTIAQQSALNDIKAEVQRKVEIVEQLRTNYEILNEQHNVMAEQYAPQNIRELLQEAAGESDVACEEIAERFLSGHCSVEVFLQDYTEARKLSQTRKIKEERLASQLNALQRAGF